MDTPLHLDLSAPVATLWLNRPDRHNALDRNLMAALIDAAHTVSDTDAVRALVVRGTGKHFSVGMDLKEQRPAPTTLLERRRDTELGQRLIQALRDIRQPTVCALQGVATGGAACIATACDFRIAAADARLGYGEVKLGMNLMWQALPLCVALVGPARAKQLVMTGRLFPADVLADWGMVDAVVPGAELGDRALGMAEEYAALPPVAVQAIKRSINVLSGPLDQALMHMDADQFLLLADTEDAGEGRAAFREKRPGEFSGK